MASNLDYAQLATDVYARSLANATPLVGGWSEVARQEDDTWGFSASAYLKGDEVVISFAGTNQAADWASNVPAGVGLGAFQITEALAFALDVMAQNPGKTFTMTGHSLGGGLASVMSVFLNLQATVFDPAPFELTARDDIVLGALQAYLLANGYNNSAFDDYTASLGALFAQREANVTSYSMDGEVLEYLRAVLPNISGQAYEYNVGTPPITEAVPGSMAISLHSMDLLSSVMRSLSFNEGMIEQNRAFSVFADSDLYASDTRADRADFLAKMHNWQLQSGSTNGNGILDMLGFDLKGIGTSGTAFEKDLNRGVLAAVAEYYYFQTGTVPESFINLVAGGIQLDLTEIAAGSDHKGQDYLLEHAQQWLLEEDNIQVDTADIQRVTLQSGSSGLLVAAEQDAHNDLIIGAGDADEVSGGAGDDILIGLDGSDTLRGGAGKDLIYGGDDDDTLYAGASEGDTDTSKNELYGGWGNDKLYGSAGNDLINGGDDADILHGGDGFDLYKVDNLDTLMDTDGRGAVYRGNFQLTGGTRKETDPENTYNGRGDTYVLDGTTLTINGGLTIEEFENGDLGIFLTTEPDDEDKPDMGPAETRASPLTIDLDGNGVSTVAYSNRRYFDHDGNGLAESTAWVGASDGLLVRDLNGNGAIDNGRELFGSNTRLGDGSLAANGFVALGELDDNHDGVVDANDAAFASLRIWRDANGNGVTDAGELLSIADAGIAGFRTAWSASSLVDANGQAHQQVGSAIRIDGGNAAMSDVWYTTDPSERINQVEVSPGALLDVLQSPDAKAFGNLVDLRQALATDPGLVAMLDAYLAEPSETARNGLLKNLIFRWAGVSNIVPTSRGGNVDARELAVVELLSARPYTNQYTPNDPIPRQEAGNLLTSEFNKFRQYVDAQLRAQADYAGSGIFLGGFASGYTHAMIDWNAFKAYMIAAQDGGQTTAVIDLVVLSTALSAYSPTLRGQLDAAYVELTIARPAIAPLLDVLSAVTGTDQADVLYGGGGKDAVNGGKGDDALYGQGGDDIYVYRPGDGNDRIFDSAGTDQIYFMGGIVPGDLSLSRDISSIIIHVNSGGVTGEIRINNVYEGTEGALREGVIEQFRFEDGTTWSQAQILAAVVQQATEGDDGLYGTTLGETLDGLGGNDDIAGYGGDDIIRGRGGNDTLGGGAGNDIVEGGEGNDGLEGGTGDDILTGGLGNDSLSGGGGNDAYVFALGDGQDTINNYDAGQSRMDVLSFGAGVDPSAVTARRTGNSLVLTIAGTDDRITVTNYFDGDAAGASRLDEIRFADAANTVWHVAAIKAMVLAATAGDDVLTGYDSADSLAGEAGNDALSGKSGDDVLTGGLGNDALSGGAGNDLYVFQLGDGQDTIDNYDAAQGRVDALSFGPGIDPAAVTARRIGNNLVLSIAGGTDQVSVSNFFIGDGTGAYRLDEVRFADAAATVWNVDTIKALVLVPTADADSLSGYAGDDALSGAGGDDTLYGNEGADTLQGDAGSDHLDGGAGNDVLAGGSGNDVLVGGGGSDIYRFDLGGGQDTISNYDSSQGRLDALQFGAGIAPTDVTARRINDDLVLAIAGTSDRVTITNHFLSDGTSGYQIDEIRFAATDAPVWDQATIRALVLAPTEGEDVLRGYETADVLAGGGGNDLLEGRGGADLLQGEAGDDTLFGGEGSDTLLGGDGKDTLDGESADDVLDGGQGEDILRGGAGNDHLTGGLGDDQLQGGAGNDAYHFSAGDGRDSIRDNDGLNTIYLSGLPLDQVYFRREDSALAVYFLNSPDDRIRMEDFFDPTTQLARFPLTVDLGNGQQRLLDADALNQASLAGTALNDVILGNTLDNVIAALAGNDTVRAGSGADELDGGEGDDLLYGESGNDVLNGGAGSDLLDGGTGADLMQGGDGDDMYFVDDVADIVSEIGTSGSDTLQASVDYTLAQNVETLILVGDAALDGTGNDADNTLVGNTGDNHVRGLAGNDVLSGGYGNDFLEGNDGNDLLDGGAGTDRMEGGVGDDAYEVDDASDIIVELSGQGFDVVHSTAYEYVLSSGIERIELVEGSGARTAVGSADNNALIGNTGDNVLDGAGGDDYLAGGAGDDVYVVDSAGDQVTELDGEGVDTVQSSVDYTLGATLENLLLTGTSNLNGTGNDGDNVLVGNAGANRLDGGLGGDDMYGGAGDDYFINDSNQDWIYEYAGEGIDTVERRYETNLVLSANAENLILAAGITTGNGNELDNTLTGNTGNNTLGGWDGDDVLYGLDGDDNLFGGTGTDTLYGGNGADYLDGDEGVDQLEGGAGNDIYVTDNSADVVVEAVGAGTDQVQTTASYTLSANIENLFLMGSSAIDGTGNDLDNYIAGNSAANVIQGGGGSDTIVAGGGNDTLLGGTGDDKYVFDANSGSDVIDNSDGGFDGVFFTNGITRERLTFGRDGDDLLIFVDAASTPSVRVLSHFLGGNAAIDYVQPDGGFYLTTAEINQIVAGGGTGGQFDQVIQGTAAGEQLVGGTGKDLIEGLAGADTLFGMGGDDTLRGGEGNDYLSGGNGSGTSSGNDTLEGGAGNDTLRGEDGSNTLTGGAGDDQYVYGGGIDVIDNTGGGTDWLFFQNGITAAQLGFTRSGDDLVITVNGNASQRVTVTGHFLGGDMALDFLQPASGSALNTVAINALVTNNGGGDPGGGTPGTGNDADYPSVKTGTAAGEQIVGTSGRDLIKGLGGADTLFGMGADDKLDGGDGDDYLSGGNGSFSGSGIDILIGGAGNDQLVGEDGDDMLFGGVGDDTYFYAAGSGADTVDNTGGGTDWLYFDGIARTQLTYHRDGDDLVVRVDGDAGQQIRVLDHFLGGEHAIAYVQPGDGGYAISAATIAGQLTPMGAASRTVAPMALGAMQTQDVSPLAMDEAGRLALAIEAFAIDAPVVKAPVWAETLSAPIARRPLEVVVASLAPTASQAAPNAPVAQAAPAGATNAIPAPQTELQQLVETLASFSSQGALPAANDMALDDLLGFIGSAPNWRGSHRSDSLHVRQLER